MQPFGGSRSSTSSTLCVAMAIICLLGVSPAMGFSPVPIRKSARGGTAGACDALGSKKIASDFINGANDNDQSSNRRGFFHSMAAIAAVASATTTKPSAVQAFENRKDDRYANAMAQTGTQPKDLGPSQRSNYVGLKECGASPNCWVSSGQKTNNPARWLPAWEANGGSIEDVKKVIDTYKVGQNDIDGGGFKVIDYNTSEKYIYVQFQSYKAGYIDDFECWYNPESKKFDVRSSSRIGYSDLGVNAIRLEYIGNRLEKEYGWTLERRRNGKLV